MTETEWLISSVPDELLQFLRRKGSTRKLRLFACAACLQFAEAVRQKLPEAISRLPKNESVKNAIRIAERFADGEVTKAELSAAYKTAETTYNYKSWMECAFTETARPAAWKGADQVAMALCDFEDEFPDRAVWSCSSRPPAALNDTPAYLADLLRHIFGNPFRPPSAPRDWPSSTGLLAQAVYDGEKSVFALHDALLDASNAELAAHFRDPKERHPKGCWALDLILGKN